MTDYCIWVDLSGQTTTDAASDAAAACGLQLYSGTLPAGIFVATAGREPQIIVDDDLVIVLDGSPRWLDSSAHRAAAERGIGKVLGCAFRESGGALFARLTGTFSLVFLKEHGRHCVFGIDRMGVGALAYRRLDRDRYAIGSNAIAVARAPGQMPRISYQSLFDYSFFHIVPSPRTIFDGVAKLQQAHYARIEPERVTTVRYWLPDFRSGTGRHATAPTEQGLFDCIDSAVRRSSERAGSVGCFLSGGLDSSTVAGTLARQHTGRSVAAYTVGFAQEGYDETGFARAAANQFDLDLHEHYIQIDDIAEAIEKITAAFDEPFGNSSAVPSLFCAEAAKRDGIDTLLAGDGGDELFGGNERYAKQKVFALYDLIPCVVRKQFLEKAFRGDEWRFYPFRKTASYVSQASRPMPDRMHSYNFMLRTGFDVVFTEDLLARIDTAHPRALMRAEWEAAPTDALLDRMLFFDWKFTLADNDLRKVGRTAQKAGVHVAYPLLDNEVVEFANTLPPSEKVHRLRLRHFYRNALANFLPDMIINKEKHGFGLPVGEWVRKSPELQSLIYGALRGLAERGVLNEPFVDNVINRHQNEHAAYYGNIIWVLSMLEHWLQKHAGDAEFV